MVSTIPDFETIRVECDGRRATLTLNRPDRLNALSNQLMAEVADAAAWFDHQADLRVVVVRGAGRAFSSGFDLTVFGDEGPSPAGGRVPADTGRLMADALERTSPVLVAALHGHVVGGGLVLAAACLLYTSPSPRDQRGSRMPSSA